jgi:hypothetical protein
MVLLDNKVYCPYCGATQWIEIDVSGGLRQQYIEDCQICCRPMDISVSIVDDTQAEVHIRPAEDF